MAELHTHLLLLVRRKDVDDTVDALGGIGSVKGGKDEMSRLRSGYCGADGFEIPHFSHQDNVRILPESPFESFRKGGGIGPHFPLMDYGTLRGVKIFYGIFDGDDVTPAVHVDAADYGGQGGGFAAPRRPRDEKEASQLIRHSLKAFGKMQILQGTDIFRYHPKRHGRIPTFDKTVSPKTGNSAFSEGHLETEIHFEMLPGLLYPLFRKEFPHHGPDVLRLEGGIGSEVFQLPVLSEGRGDSHSHVQIARIRPEGFFQ